MGIPAYFAYLVRNYPEVVKEYKPLGVDNFYIDANSIIYDIIYKSLDAAAMENITSQYAIIIEKTIAYLTDLILYVGATQTYIAFDGVAPCAKMEQQRQRRARAAVAVSKGITFITPGTPFMCKLNECVYAAFRDIKGVIVSGADVPGEGEHKIFEHIRGATLAKSRVVVYGLDADLIILALCHMDYCGDISLLRERNKVDGASDDGGRVIVRIGVFADKIKELGVNVRDYIFMSFFLGNDFMPHFPVLNIRRDGIGKLVIVYKELFGNCSGSDSGSIFTDYTTGRPLWSNVRKFIGALAQKESDWMYFDYLECNKMEQRLAADPVAVDDIENTPMLNRALEKYVAPDYPNWEERYYKALLEDIDVAALSHNWVKGLEWVMRYYVCGVPDWKWKYGEHYPPLLVDIYKHMPIATDGECFFNAHPHASMTPQEQLDYVMPCVGDTIKLEWAYCRYFWESHVRICKAQNAKKNDLVCHK